MDLDSVTVCYWMSWYEKAMILFAMVYPILGMMVARRRLASGRGSIVTLATLPLTAGAVTFWLRLSETEDVIRISSLSNGVVSSVAEASMPLFVACLSALLVLAGTLPYRVAAAGEGLGSTRLASIVNGAPFVLAAAGLIYGVMLQASALPGSLVGTVLGFALIGLHLIAIGLPMRPESRATAKTVFVSTAILALVIWQYRHFFQVAINERPAAISSTAASY